jgi:hypothetical protein
MTSTITSLTKPAAGEDYRSPSKQRKAGFVLAFVGLILAGVTLIANIVAASSNDPDSAAETLAWSFGLTTTAFGTIKLGIAVILVGILVRLWLRIESVKTALPELKPDGNGTVRSGSISTDFGPATVSNHVPDPLPIHRMARTMWAPMIVMGYMAVIAGLVVSFVWSGNVGTETGAGAQAWTQGLQFLGEGMLLAGISFLLGSILGSLREGGGKVQKSVGLSVETLKMPNTAKGFIALMALGLMVSVGQFIGYVFVAATVDSAQSFASWLAWLGPLREAGLGLLLAGIVLALVTIGNVLGFQFSMLRRIITTGN